MIEYDKDAIVPPYITEYLRAKTVHNDEFMHSLEKYAEENSVPIVEPETARFLSVMCRTVKPKKILEVGCAIGYSSILMAQATDDDCEIATLECNEDMVRIARENIKTSGYAEKISVIEADAKDYLSYIDDDEVFDMIFLDGPKTKLSLEYGDIYHIPYRSLISDNVLYKGMTADDNHVVRRKITIVKRLRKYIDMLMEHKELETSLLPLGDGVTISVKK
jgi:predicted O-methyltransferase YrrM